MESCQLRFLGFDHTLLHSHIHKALLGVLHETVLNITVYPQNELFQSLRVGELLDDLDRLDLISSLRSGERGQGKVFCIQRSLLE